MMGALLEGRNVVGLEPCTQLNNASSWRLSIFKDTEDIIRRKAPSSAGNPEDTMLARLLVDDIDELLHINQFQASSDDSEKLKQMMMDLVKSCHQIFGEISEATMAKWVEMALNEFNTRVMLKAILESGQDGIRTVTSWMIDTFNKIKEGPTKAPPGSTPE